jgi:phosphoribosylformimino-5-aminoimidazole carboxamide ribotide isomerase
MIIIPAIDIFEDKIVRLKKGNFDNITYYKNEPLQQAQIYESMGYGLIHIIDLLGSKTGKFTALESVKKIKRHTKLQIEFGGGIRDVKTAAQVFSAGADYAIIGSLSVKNREEFELIIKRHSPEKIIAAVDVKDEKLSIAGWTEETSVSLFSHIEYCKKLGIDKFLCTDISKDGMLAGLNFDLYRKTLEKFPNIKLVASGGVKDINDIKKLKEINPYAVVVGKAIYEGKIDLEELKEFAV